MKQDNEKMQHESYASISVTRVSGGAKGFYGSRIPHDRWINLRINHGYAKRDLNTTYFLEGSRILELRMTEAQFAELITGLNVSRVPCTLEYLEGKTFEEPEIENTRLRFRQEFGEHIDSISQRAKDIESGVFH